MPIYREGAPTEGTCWHHGCSERAHTDGVQALLAVARGPDRGHECTGMPVSHERVHQRMRVGQSRHRERCVAIVMIMVALAVVHMITSVSMRVPV